MSDTIHACFISYRHPAAEGSREAKLIAHVCKAISDHVQMYTHKHEVYFDQKRLVPGYQYDECLAEAICRSACMVVVYWPAYLESAPAGPGQPAARVPPAHPADRARAGGRPAGGRA